MYQMLWRIQKGYPLSSRCQSILAPTGVRNSGGLHTRGIWRCHKGSRIYWDSVWFTRDQRIVVEWNDLSLRPHLLQSPLRFHHLNHPNCHPRPHHHCLRRRHHLSIFCESWLAEIGRMRLYIWSWYESDPRFARARELLASPSKEKNTMKTTYEELPMILIYSQRTLRLPNWILESDDVKLDLYTQLVVWLSRERKDAYRAHPTSYTQVAWSLTYLDSEETLRSSVSSMIDSLGNECKLCWQLRTGIHKSQNQHTQEELQSCASRDHVLSLLGKPRLCSWSLLGYVSVFKPRS